MSTTTSPRPELDVTFGELGALLLDGGLSVTDVRGSLEEIRRRAAPDDELAFAVLPEHVLVSRPGIPFATTTVSTGGVGLTSRQAAHASRLAQELQSGRVPLDDARARMAEIRALPWPGRATQGVVGAALISAGLAVVFRCPWWAVVLALLVGAVVGVVTEYMSRIRPAAAIVPFVSAFVSTLIVGTTATALDLGPVPLFAVCAPIAILVPGALITNALLELTAADIVTGASRLMYGLIMLAFMATGVSAGALLTGLRIDSDSAALVGQAALVTAERGGWEAVPPVPLAWIGVVVLAVGIGLAFGSGPRLTLVCVVVMSGTYALLSVLSPLLGSAVATGVSAAVLFVAARVIERLTVAIPATVSFQPAFLLLVPGTVGLVALASFDADALAAAPAIFLSLCIGTKVGALIADLSHVTATAFRARRAGRPGTGLLQ
ncbi:threonine/serine exporter family protein [Microbacterium resistens]|uniref:threonine/serine exporter family protein n=1 Tax=Microbacterium resistens TaxID=156977 RepID=UPI0027E332CE|nr:threonine/serine exporter family protein [Microbacterium resistens]MBW1638187.1 threonine/serine exporter family protein [Microbacterium resistens]